MSGYGTSLFLHLVGAILLFSAAVLTHFVGAKLRKATTVQEVRLWLGFARGAQPLFPIGGIILLLTGLHLAGAGWDFRQPWILVGLVVLLILLPMGPLVQRPRFMAIGMAAATAEPGPVPPSLSEAILNPFTWRYLSGTTGLALGQLWIMTQKPGWTGALVAPLVLGVIGWIYGGALAAKDREAVRAGEPAVAQANR
jgi:hypothetical protein